MGVVAIIGLILLMCICVILYRILSVITEIKEQRFEIKRIVDIEKWV